jgi:hypothetical protein
MGRIKKEGSRQTAGALFLFVKPLDGEKVAGNVWDRNE